MPVYIVTGTLGDGKSLCAVSRALEYLQQRRRVVSNFPIDVARVSARPGDAFSDAIVEVIPPQPGSHDLHALGRGGPDENTSGLLILDECATFLNSREWNGKDRQEVINWMLHSRKLGWDLMLLVQHHSALDKQVREMVAQFHVICRRMDRLTIPIINWIFPLKLPKIHVALVRYGFGQGAMVSETWTFRATALYGTYDTKWVSVPQSHESSNGWYCVLPPRLSRWRYESQRTWRDYLRDCWNPPPRRSSSRSPTVTRCDPLRKLPTEVRWAAARRLSQRGLL